MRMMRTFHSATYPFHQRAARAGRTSLGAPPLSHPQAAVNDFCLMFFLRQSEEFVEKGSASKPLAKPQARNANVPASKLKEGQRKKRETPFNLIGWLEGGPKLLRGMRRLRGRVTIPPARR